MDKHFIPSKEQLGWRSTWEAPDEKGDFAQSLPKFRLKSASKLRKNLEKRFAWTTAFQVLITTSYQNDSLLVDKQSKLLTPHKCIGMRPKDLTPLNEAMLLAVDKSTVKKHLAKLLLNAAGGFGILPPVFSS